MGISKYGPVRFFNRLPETKRMEALKYIQQNPDVRIKEVLLDMVDVIVDNDDLSENLVNHDLSVQLDYAAQLRGTTEMTWSQALEAAGVVFYRRHQLNL
jgi:hypothetical protein